MSVDVYAVPKAVPGMRVKVRELLEISVGGTWLVLNSDAAVQVYNSIRAQLDTAEIIRLTAYCSRTSSQILNFPMSRVEAKELMTDMEPFIYGE